MFLNGPWYIGRVKKDAPDVYANTKLAPLPQVAGGTFGGTIAFPLSNLAAGNTDNATKRAAVVSFLKFMTAPDNVRAISESSGSLFAIKYKVDTSKVDPLQAQFTDSLNSAAFAIPHIQFQLPAKVTAQLGQGFGAMALGNMTPQQFVDFMHQQLLAAQ